jgi:hypothetical protein
MKLLRINLLMISVLTGTSAATAQKNKSYQLASPDGNIVLKIEAGDKLQWSVTDNSSEVIAPSAMSGEKIKFGMQVL